MAAEILSVGHASWDLCFIADHYPAENAKAETGVLIEAGGGPAANAAWLLARWGASTALAALVGADTYGEKVRAELEATGIDCRLLERRAGHVTPVSSILVNSTNGSRTICNRKVAADYRPDFVGMPRLDPDWLLFDGHELPASLAALEAFPRAGTVLDAGSLREGTRVLAGRVRFLVASERFATQVIGQPPPAGLDPDYAGRLRRFDGQMVVVTLGERGLIFDDGDRKGSLRALPGPVEDTTGAGDVFHGAFAWALRSHEPLDQALRLATTAAGLSVRRQGCRGAIPDLDDVLRALPGCPAVESHPCGSTHQSPLPSL